MADSEDRINGAIEAVGFYKWQDPEAVADLQAMQRMYERIADNLRDRKNIPFAKVLSELKKKAEEQTEEGAQTAGSGSKPEPEPPA